MRVDPSDCLALEGSGVLSGIGSASVQDVLLEVGILSMVISPIVSFMVMSVIIVTVIVVNVVVFYIIKDIQSWCATAPCLAPPNCL